MHGTEESLGWLAVGVVALLLVVGIVGTAIDTAGLEREKLPGVLAVLAIAAFLVFGIVGRTPAGFSRLTRTAPGTLASPGGSARFMSYAAARKAGLIGHLDDGGLVLGGATEAVWQPQKGGAAEWDPFRFDWRPGRVRIRGEGHIMVFAPTGAGKTTGLVFPIMLSYPGSVVVIDIKGEIYRRTAAYRNSMSDVYVIDPMGIAGGPRQGGFDLCGFIDPQNLKTDCDWLASLIEPHDPSLGQNRFFHDSSRQFISAMIAHTMTAKHLSPADRHLGYGYERMVADSFDALLAEMLDNPTTQVRHAAQRWSSEAKGNQEVRSNIETALDFLGNDSIKNSLRGGIDLHQLKRGRPKTVYLCLPLKGLQANAVFMRLFLGCTLSAIKHDTAVPQHRVAIVCDEFQNLGSCDAIAQDISLIRSSHANFLLIVQSRAVLERLYGQLQVHDFLNNSAMQIHFQPTDFQVLQEVSSMLGTTTVEVEDVQIVQGRRTVTKRMVDRPLLRPEEVRRLPKDLMLLFPTGRDPLPCRRIADFDDPVLRRR